MTAEIVVLDRQGHIVAVNDAWRRFGRENNASESLIRGVGLDYFKVCRNASGSSSEIAHHCLNGLLGILNGSLNEFQLAYPCPSPTKQRWFHLRAVPWVRSEGGIIISHLDISERKEMEDALRKSEERFRSLVDSIEDYAIFMLDAAGKIASWNEGAERIYGYPESEIIGRPYSTLFLPGDIQSGKPDSLLNMAATQDHISHEDWRSRKDASPFWVNIAIKTMRNSAGELLGFSTITRDLTERRQAEMVVKRGHRQAVIVAELGQQALATTELGALMNSIVARVAQCLEVEFCQILELLPNANTFLLRAGTGWRQGLVGRARIPCEGQSHAGYTLLKKEPVIFENLRHETRFTESSLLHDHGVVSGVNVIIHGQQRSLGILGVYTRQHRTFTQDDIHFLQAVANVLATAIERIHSEQLLIQAQKMQAVGQLTGGVAHDFNNMLTIIIGNLQVIEGRIKSDTLLSQFIQAALEGARRGAELVNKLLIFSRHQALQPRQVDLNYQIVNMTSLLRRTLGETIEIETLPGHDLWKAFADPNQVETALLNLAINARDAMPQGGKLIIETANVLLDENYALREAEVTPGQYIMLAVSDTGVGIPPEAIKHVFEPFFTTKEVGKGSGLGLSMVYGFAKQSGGHVKIYSESGYGTTVKLYLPRASHTRESPVQREPSGQMRSTRGETILVVEDEEGVRKLAVQLLTELGYRVLQAGNGQAALSLLDKPIDLLFVDMILPGGINGIELARQVQQRHPKSKVLFCSGYTKSSALALREKVDRNAPLLCKPYGKEELARNIRDVLDDKSG